MHRRSVLLLTAALVAASSVGASASPPPPVEVGTGGCDSGYSSVVNVGPTHVCRRQLSPDAFVSNERCPATHVEVGIGEIGQYVCVTA